jgi:hypothetical protein
MIVKKVILLSVIFVLPLLLAACQPSVDEAKADFCEDLGEFGIALAQYRQINETSTKDDLQKAQSDVEKTWADLQKSAETLGEVQTDSVEDAYGDLQKGVNDIPDDATLGDAELMVKQGVLSTLEEVLRISTTTCTYGQGQ